ncbi:conserved protein of unknown function [Magnetospirillum sp. XM-1]|uniref:nucleotidyltransferase domain-containing protein n=1 Tax=Magnetospirillum sp. XM-1 TaxID=1663591 RepID=UPI00073DCFC1|nr:nucleotidyltransferase domain-containing protein [Magnetospirillum sp. XM-1]CUW37150.1 conserved protein of unknown function [Magnetospirillum sp. XM-1]
MIPDNIRHQVNGLLDQVEADHDVRILFAVESGSRAWGFPSPDSDYDIRFVYVRPLTWYVRLSVGRDVIERPIVDNLDVGGWDLRKALSLLVRANPALIEWLSSPIVYRERPETAAIRALAELSPHRHSARYHYRALAWSNYTRYIAKREMVKLKKYMYCIRPAAALRWLRTRPDRVPMDFPSLLAGIKMEADLQQAIDSLLALKVSSLEMGEGPHIPRIDDFIETEMDLAVRPDGPPSIDPSFQSKANELFQSIVLRQCDN